MDPRGCTKLRSSLEAVLGWKSYLHDVTELPDEKNEQRKLFVVRNTPISKAVMGSLRRGLRSSAEPELTSGRLVRDLHAPPPVCLDLYVEEMI